MAKRNLRASSGSSYIRASDVSDITRERERERARERARERVSLG